MAYISKLYNLSKPGGIIAWVAYVIRSCDFPKKEILIDYISQLHNHIKILNSQKFGKIPKKF
jgi:hypothetical protein